MCKTSLSVEFKFRWFHSPFTTLPVKSACTGMREANECNPRSLSLLSHDNSWLSRQVEPNAEPFSQNVFQQKNGLLATVHCTWSSTSDKSRETSGRYYHSVWCLCGMTGLKSIKTLKTAQRRCRPDKENLLNLDWRIMLKLSVENQFSAPVVVVRLLDKWRTKKKVIWLHERLNSSEGGKKLADIG